jgi:hypothetical protein
LRAKDLDVVRRLEHVKGLEDNIEKYFEMSKWKSKEEFFSLMRRRRDLKL